MSGEGIFLMVCAIIGGLLISSLITYWCRTLFKHMLDAAWALNDDISIDEKNLLESLRKYLSITIREQQSLLNTIETLKKERYGIQEEIRTAEQSICSLQSKLNN